MLKEPRNDFASPVRELATTTASLMFLRAQILVVGQNHALAGRYSFFVEIGECFSFGSQLLEQRGWLPKFAMNSMKFADALVNLLQPNAIGVPHRASAIGGESVAVEIDDVDIACT